MLPSRFRKGDLCQRINSGSSHADQRSGAGGTAAGVIGRELGEYGVKQNEPWLLRWAVRASAVPSSPSPVRIESRVTALSSMALSQKRERGGRSRKRGFRCWTVAYKMLTFLN